MKLRRVHVENYRSIVDSGPVDTDERVTVIIGKNEQGKTNFLKAIGSFNHELRYQPNDLPNHLRPSLEKQEAGKVPIVTLWINFEGADKSQLKDIVKDVHALEGLKVTRFFGGNFLYAAVKEGGGEVPIEFSPPDLSSPIETLRNETESLREKLRAHVRRLPIFAAALPQAEQHIDAFKSSNFSDTPQIENLIRTFATALKGLPSQDKPIQDDISATIGRISSTQVSMQEMLKSQHVAILHGLFPHFLFHSTSVDRIPNEVRIADFVQDPEKTSKGMAYLCSVAGLSAQKIQELANSADTPQREAYEDHYRASISGAINEFWTQATYHVHFRIEKDKLSVSISDNTYSPRIPLSERSDGFQWYLSFYCALLNEATESRPTVLLLDNPGLELHADGQRDIKRFLEEKLPQSTQVVYVTHSPAMIDPYNLAQVRCVELHGNQKGTKVVNIIRNACTISETVAGISVVNIDKHSTSDHEVGLVFLHKHPFAIFECKRVGIEEGMKKGPQTIEKAKQGAYVARSVSSLQKVRLRDGQMHGVIQRGDGSLYSKPYQKLLREVVDSNDAELLEGFVLTVGVVSNHGNWFTAENHNKELKVLAQSYDWLLFLTDRGLAEFIDELLLNPKRKLEPARKAFLTSYSGEKGRNRFTKVRMDIYADQVLQDYFKTNGQRIESWFNIIAPKSNSLNLLRGELTALRDKNWKKIFDL